MVWEPESDQSPESKAEFWAPEKEGETLVGLVTQFNQTRNGRYIQFSPVIHYPVTGKPQGYLTLLVGINSWLKKVIDERKHIDKHLAIKFTGLESTPEGKMRTFEVYVLTSEQWDKERVAHLSQGPVDGEPPF